MADITSDSVSIEIYTELESPSSLTQSGISYWLQNNLGAVNILLCTSFVKPTGGAVAVAEEDESLMDETEKTIWKYLYYIRYYNKLMLDNLGAAGIQDVIEYQSDGGRIKRYNKNEIAKSYLSLKQGAEDTLKDLLVAYNSCVPSAMSIQGEDAFYQGGCVVNDIIDSCRRC